jgi:TonB family protein
MKYRKGIAVCVTSLVLCCTVARANDLKEIERQLRKTYDNYLLSLKAPYASEKLHFTSKGLPVGLAPEGVWTTNGILQVSKIVLKPNIVQIYGKRILLALRTSQGNPILLPIVTARSVQIAIDLDSTSASNIDQINLLFEQVFQKQDIRQRIAAYWTPAPTDHACGTLPAGVEPMGMLEGNRPVYGKCAGIEPPKVLYSQDPEYTPSAKQKRIEGTSVVEVIVNEKGLPEILEITKDLGEGLDIQALSAVSGWRFRPAMLKGQPVAVNIAVEVSFHLF